MQSYEIMYAEWYILENVLAVPIKQETLPIEQHLCMPNSSLLPVTCSHHSVVAKSIIIVAMLQIYLKLLFIIVIED